MSELKTYKMIDEEYCSDCVCVIPSEVYLKSEADKYIDRLKEKYCHAMACRCFYASLSHKDTALRLQEEGDDFGYCFWSRQSDKEYRRGKRWQKLMEAYK